MTSNDYTPMTQEDFTRWYAEHDNPLAAPVVHCTAPVTAVAHGTNPCSVRLVSAGAAYASHQHHNAQPTGAMMRIAAKVHDARCVSALPELNECGPAYPGQYQAVCACNYASVLHDTATAALLDWMAHTID